MALLGARLAGAIFISKDNPLLAQKDASPAAQAVPDEVMSDFWEGLDIGSADHRQRLQVAGRVYLRPRRRSLAKHGLHNSDKKLALLGPFDTGTHLLLNTLMANHQTHLYKACDWDTLTIDHDKTAHCRLWKHGINISDSPHNQGGEPVYEVLKRQGVQPKDTVVVMMVRNPLATLTAWKKAAYDLGPCAWRALDEYDQACSARHIKWHGDGQPDKFATASFSSTMDAYNRYMRMYSAIQNEGRVHAAVLVTYEDMVYSPGDVVNEIADAMGWPQRDDVAVIDAPAKSHGDAHGRDRALEKLRGRDWLQKIPSDAVRKAMCMGLDTSVLQGIQDNRYDSDEPSKSYAADCNGYL